MKIYLLFLILFLVSPWGFAQDQGQGNSEGYLQMKNTSDAFFEAYSTINVDKLISLFDDDAHFIDETYAPENDGIGLDLKGKVAVKQMFDEAAKYIKKAEWAEEKRYFSGNQGVFIGKVTLHYNGLSFGKTKNDTVLWTTNYAIVLTFKDGKIIRENDFIDYGGASIEEL